MVQTCLFEDEYLGEHYKTIIKKDVVVKPTQEGSCFDAVTVDAFSAMQSFMARKKESDLVIRKLRRYKK